MKTLKYAKWRAGNRHRASAFPSVQLQLCFLADCYSFSCCVTNHLELSGIENSHFLMPRESVSWEFREGTGNLARLCALMSETSSEKAQRAGESNAMTGFSHDLEPWPGWLEAGQGWTCMLPHQPDSLHGGPVFQRMRRKLPGCLWQALEAS